MHILAFGHRKRVGKDTCGTFVQTFLRTANKFRSIQKKGFADKVKEQCYELFSWGGLQPGSWYEQPGNEVFREIVLPKLGQTPRQLWIGHGMACRTYYPQVWVDYLLNGTQGCDFLIVTDMRFPNEAEAIKKLGGKVVKLVRPDIPDTNDAADIPLSNYTDWDSIITNDGDLRSLNRKVVSEVERLFFERPTFSDAVSRSN